MMAYKRRNRRFTSREVLKMTEERRLRESQRIHMRREARRRKKARNQEILKELAWYGLKFLTGALILYAVLYTYFGMFREPFC